jgi:hypothetical protein
LLNPFCTFLAFLLGRVPIILSIIFLYYSIVKFDD